MKLFARDPKISLSPTVKEGWCRYQKVIPVLPQIWKNSEWLSLLWTNWETMSRRPMCVCVANITSDAMGIFSISAFLTNRKLCFFVCLMLSSILLPNAFGCNFVYTSQAFDSTRSMMRHWNIAVCNNTLTAPAQYGAPFHLGKLKK